MSLETPTEDHIDWDLVLVTSTGRWIALRSNHTGGVALTGVMDGVRQLAEVSAESMVLHDEL